MQKKLNIAWKVIVIVLICATLVGAVFFYTKRDEIVTSNITMDYFIETVNNHNEEQMESFVANSNNDILYNNFKSVLNNNYYYEGISDLKFTIDNYSVFGTGKYQCYFANAFENYASKCDLENEGRYMNYLVDTTVEYKENGLDKSRKEKGIVVFVKDMGEGNYFTWKLVRFDRYTVTD